MCVCVCVCVCVCMCIYACVIIIMSVHPTILHMLCGRGLCSLYVILCMPCECVRSHLIYSKLVYLKTLFTRHFAVDPHH